MAKLRRMLGDINSWECKALMGLISTQSKITLVKWAVVYAEQNYLEIYRREYMDDIRLDKTIAACKNYANGKTKLSDVKLLLKEAATCAREVTETEAARAAAHAVAAACAVVQTPSNALGFLFYGAAATAYHRAGIQETQEVYDKLALNELKKAYESLKKAAVPDEAGPVKINWNC